MEVFQNAGKKPGLQIWRVEKMKLQEIPKEQYGDFYMGDAYIILATSSAPSYNVHTWQGSQASQDETGAAAILMVQLDNYLNNHPVQYTEFQNDESSTFMSYFRHGIRYKKGGIASGFKDVTTNEVDVKRLLHVKGRRSVRATEVDFSWDSFNCGDCFIIDLGENIYHWSGHKSNHFERLKSTQVAVDIRDNERRGRAKIERIIEGEESEEVSDTLGPKPDTLPDPDFQQVSTRDKSETCLYMISDLTGSMKATHVASGVPFKQDMLCPKECFILADKSDRTIYVWKGPMATDAERKVALKAAKQFIKDRKMHDRTKVVVFPAGSEPTLFKENFFNWLDKDETTGPSEAYTIGSIAKIEKIPFDPASLHDNNAMAAQHSMVDDGSGEFTVFRVEHGQLEEVDRSTYGHLFGGDCYLVEYTYERNKVIIYIWQGNKCSKDELGASAILAVEKDKSMGGSAILVRVTQGQEPPHLAAIFKGRMIVHLGGTSRGSGQSAAGSIRLFNIRISSTNATRAVEVQPTASALNTNDVFVLKTPDGVTIWKGLGAVEEEMEEAKRVAEFLKGPVREVEEENEPADFWNALGGKAKYQTSKTLRNNTRSPRLFGCSNKTGNLIAEEVPGDCQQLDLATDDIMILDTGDQIFLWIGKDANEEERNGVERIAQEYVDSDPSGRTGVPITTIKQGNEPPSFTGWFQAWDPNAWGKMDALTQKFS